MSQTGKPSSGAPRPRKRASARSAGTSTGRASAASEGSTNALAPVIPLRGRGEAATASKASAPTATNEPAPPEIDPHESVESETVETETVETETVETETVAGASEPAGWEKRIAGGLAFLRRRITGEYEVDEFGFDPDLTDHIVVPAFRPLYDRWFRTEVHGAQNLPTDGGALLVANHGGALWALDGVMTALAVHDSTPGHRYLRMLGADLVFSTPVLGPFARKTGSTLACTPDAERLLRKGELVGVWPEGYKGIGKPFSERYKLQRFGRGGFVTAALRTGVPIIPVSIVGAEEIHPMLFNATTLARAMGLPYFPITPTFPWLGPLGLVPLPSKWHIEFGAPIETTHLGPDAAEDPLLTFELTDQVRETIQGTLYRLLAHRTSPWS